MVVFPCYSWFWLFAYTANTKTANSEVRHYIGDVINGRFSYLNGIRLSWNVDAVGHDADLAEERQLVVRQESVGFVEKKITPNEFFEAPIFTLEKEVKILIINLKECIYSTKSKQNILITKCRVYCLEGKIKLNSAAINWWLK